MELAKYCTTTFKNAVQHSPLLCKTKFSFMTLSVFIESQKYTNWVLNHDKFNHWIPCEYYLSEKPSGLFHI